MVGSQRQPHSPTATPSTRPARPTLPAWAGRASCADAHISYDPQLAGAAVSEVAFVGEVEDRRDAIPFGFILPAVVESPLIALLPVF